jgi:hypothetical protein
MISRGNVRGRITVWITSGVPWVKLEQDPKGDDIVACFAEARSSGLLNGPTPAMVDLLSFNGSIDWTAITAIRSLIPWERQHNGASEGRRTYTARCAYVSTDPLLAPVIKIICDLFGRSRHRQFRDPEQALLWVLQGEAPPPESVTSDD